MIAILSMDIVWRLDIDLWRFIARHFRHCFEFQDDVIDLSGNESSY